MFWSSSVSVLEPISPTYCPKIYVAALLHLIVLKKKKILIFREIEVGGENTRMVIESL
jgi:hypothetical protein